ncbi:MAG: hypothetical protein KME40_08545 [Komarekiella atlantica HA4396-MV6]|nr:hypothetical protein [Komarekiella atlantica HA4396-MV6]
MNFLSSERIILPGIDYVAYDQGWYEMFIDLYHPTVKQALQNQTALEYLVSLGFENIEVIE